ncbi:hypothetical protein HA402_011850 [Bradysia odoriphaga]|nr:hypothetical protein HA402_011850 [Bradysia odoriphaga]
MYSQLCSTLVPANGVFIHPFYNHNQYTNNAAIVTTNTLKLNPHLGFAPRSLGSLSTSTSCNLFGWGGELLDPRRDAVMVNGPVACDPNYPQSYCTVFDSVSHLTCDAMQGSPLTCGNDMTVAGFVTTDGGCSADTGRTLLNYQSVHDFRDWIVGVFGPELPERNAVNFIVTVLERNETSIPRCFGTIIASNRVVTTATCATIDSSLHVELLVQSRIVQGSSSSSTNYRASQIYIHPYYSQENPFENNVAVIEIGGTFDQRIVPRTLGNLQHNSSCQLFGWGPTDIGFTRGDPINVNAPQLCDPNHPQAFCTSHPTIFHYSCNAMTGSPVTCGGNETVVTGFLINNATCNSSMLEPASEVFIHPFYNHNQYTNNAAIVTTNTLKLNPHLGFAPRPLGSLSTSTSCNLFGWGGELLDPRRDAVMVNGPVACDPNYPQSYCTVFDSVSHLTCDAMQGSPLTCGNDMTVAGFVTTDGGCSADTGRTLLNYHSVHDFRDWIVGVFGPKLPERNAVNFIVTVLERNETSIPRCFGTIIASNRVVTTATCATIDSSLHVELLVQTRIVQGSSSSSTNYRASQIYIHPYYSQENPFENNVAVIEVSFHYVVESRIRKIVEIHFADWWHV